MAPSKPALLFYCQHSIGMGHLTRSFALTQALTQDFRVVFLNGGPFPPGLRAPEGVEIIDLPPLGMVDGHNLVSRDARFDVEEAKRLRRDVVRDAYERIDPRVVLLELFPFGRKKFAFELLPLLKAARRRARPPLVLTSVRDILVNSRPDRQHHDDRARWISDRYFDAVLVHSDPQFARLEQSFSPRVALRVPVFHTGFVLPERAHSQELKRDARVLVSAGGGMAGYPLFRAALDAHQVLWQQHKIPMRLVSGPFLPVEQWNELSRASEGCAGLELIRSVPDLCLEMSRASVSVSQCGYNTSMDILSSRVPAVVVPYSEGREDEQLNRAQRLEALGALRLFNPGKLDGTALARAIRECFGFEPDACKLDLNGAAHTASLIARLVKDRDAREYSHSTTVPERAP
jgi:predicted glycosyltransferase